MVFLLKKKSIILVNSRLTTKFTFSLGVCLLDWEKFRHHKWLGNFFVKHSTVQTFLVEIVDTFCVDVLVEIMFTKSLTKTKTNFLFVIYTHTNDNHDDNV